MALWPPLLELPTGLVELDRVSRSVGEPNKPTARRGLGGDRSPGFVFQLPLALWAAGSAAVQGER